MSDLALDPATGDLLLEGGRARLAVGGEAVAQSWACHLTLFRGECFLDPALGIDYPNDVLGKGVRPQVLRAIFAAATLETPGITELRNLRIALDRRTRVLAVEAEVLAGGDDPQTLTLTLQETVGG